MTVTRYNKRLFPYKWSCRAALAGQAGAPMETRADRVLRQNFGNIRDAYAYTRVLLEQVEALAALLFHQSPLCPELGGCYATPIATPDPPSRARRWALA